MAQFMDDVLRAFQIGQSIESNRMQMSAQRQNMAIQQQQQEQQARLQGAVQQFGQGNEKPLAEMDPITYQKLKIEQQDMRVKEQDAINGMLKFDAQRTLKKNQILGAYANFLEKNPAAAPQIQDELISKGGIDEQTARSFTPENLPQIKQHIQTVNEAWQDPDFVLNVGKNEAMAMLRITTLDQLREKVQSGEYASALDQIFQKELQSKKAGAQNINIGNDAVGLTTAAQTSATNEVRGADKKLAALDQVDKYIQEAGGHEALSSIPEGAGAAWAGIKSRLFSNSMSPKEKQRYGARGAAIAALGTFSNQIINDLSGAAVSETEWKRLTQSIPTIDDPAVVRESKIKVWRENYKTMRDLGYESITEGLKKDPSLASKLVTVDQAKNQIQLPNGWTVVQ